MSLRMDLEQLATIAEGRTSNGLRRRLRESADRIAVVLAAVQAVSEAWADPTGVDDRARVVITDSELAKIWPELEPLCAALDRLSEALDGTE